MITVHHLEYSQSFRVLWLLEELGENYALKIYERDAKTRLAPAPYKALSPLGTAPVITDGDVTLAESNAVIDYILDLYDDGRLRPKIGTPERVPYLFWYHTTQGSLMSVLLFNMILGMTKERTPALIRPIIKMVLGRTEDAFSNPRLAVLMAKLESDLGERPWLAGERLTAADITMGYPLEAMAVRGTLGDYPNCQAWVERMRATQSYKRALEKDGRDSPIFTG